MFFTNQEEMFNFLIKQYRRGDKVNIASYGMYLGIAKGQDWGTKYKSTQAQRYRKNSRTKDKI